MIAVESKYTWSIRYRLEVEANIRKYNNLNKLQSVWTRPLNEEEKKQLFGGNPNYIKNIGHKTDGKEWRLLK